MKTMKILATLGIAVSCCALLGACSPNSDPSGVIEFDIYSSRQYPTEPPPGFTMHYDAGTGLWNYMDSNEWMKEDAGYDTREHAIFWAWSWYDYNGGFKPKPKRNWQSETNTPNARPVRTDGPPRDSGTHEAVVRGSEDSSCAG